MSLNCVSGFVFFILLLVNIYIMMAFAANQTNQQKSHIKLDNNSKKSAKLPERIKNNSKK